MNGISSKSAIIIGTTHFRNQNVQLSSVFIEFRDAIFEARYRRQDAVVCVLVVIKFRRVSANADKTREFIYTGTKTYIVASTLSPVGSSPAAVVAAAGSAMGPT